MREPGIGGAIFPPDPCGPWSRGRKRMSFETGERKRRSAAERGGFDPRRLRGGTTLVSSARMSNPHIQFECLPRSDWTCRPKARRFRSGRGFDTTGLKRRSAPGGFDPRRRRGGAPWAQPPIQFSPPSHQDECAGRRPFGEAIGGEERAGIIGPFRIRWRPQRNRRAANGAPGKLVNNMAERGGFEPPVPV